MILNSQLGVSTDTALRLVRYFGTTPHFWAGTAKGVLVTTAGFKRAAKDYVAPSRERIVLIDGKKLSHLMVGDRVGVRTWVNHKVKRIDEDCFDQEVP